MKQERHRVVPLLFFLLPPDFHATGKWRIDTKNGMPACPNAGGPIIIHRRAVARRGPVNLHHGFHEPHVVGTH